MYVDLNCGTCESQLMLDSDDNSPGVWMLVHRFANAHAVCGYVTPQNEPEVEHVRTTVVSPNPRRRVVKKVRKVEEDEE
jgi:hypothetical protein